MEEEKYFWETEYPFSQFLTQYFQDNYKRKYSLVGNGIYNLVTMDGQLYEVKYSQAKTITKGSANYRPDVKKQKIIDTIVKNLKCDEEKINVYGGKYIYFPVDNWTAKVEIVKKLAMPQ